MTSATQYATMEPSMMEKNDFSDPNQREIHSASPSSSDKEGRNEREGLTWTDDEERKIRRKLDFRVVPLVTLLYLLCFLDRANVGQYASKLHCQRQTLTFSQETLVFKAWAPNWTCQVSGSTGH
jgi:hypothetical protein